MSDLSSSIAHLPAGSSLEDNMDLSVLARNTDRLGQDLDVEVTPCCSISTCGAFRGCFLQDCASRGQPVHHRQVISIGPVTLDRRDAGSKMLHHFIKHPSASTTRSILRKIFDEKR